VGVVDEPAMVAIGWSRPRLSPPSCSREKKQKQVKAAQQVKRNWPRGRSGGPASCLLYVEGDGLLVGVVCVCSLCVEPSFTIVVSITTIATLFGAAADV
jgi:hypothetical protein